MVSVSVYQLMHYALEMDTETVMDVIKNQNDLMLNLIHCPDIIDRRANIANIILSPGIAHIITGPRRSGKSVLAFQIIKTARMDM